MTLADFEPIFTALIAVVGMVITAMIPIYVPRAIAAFEAHTKVKLTDQERTAVLQAARTTAGLVETQLQQGVLHLRDVTPSNPVMLAAAKAAIARVPDSAAAVGMTPLSMSTIIVGAADTARAMTPLMVLPAKEDAHVS